MHGDLTTTISNHPVLLSCSFEKSSSSQSHKTEDNFEKQQNRKNQHKSMITQFTMVGNWCNQGNMGYEDGKNMLGLRKYKSQFEQHEEYSERRVQVRKSLDKVDLKNKTLQNGQNNDEDNNEDKQDEYKHKQTISVRILNPGQTIYKDKLTKMSEEGYDVSDMNRRKNKMVVVQRMQIQRVKSLIAGLRTQCLDLSGMMMAMSEYCSEKIMEVIEQVGKTDWGATNKRKYDSAVYNLEQDQRQQKLLQRETRLALREQQLANKQQQLLSRSLQIKQRQFSQSHAKLQDNISKQQSFNQTLAKHQIQLAKLHGQLSTLQTRFDELQNENYRLEEVVFDYQQKIVGVELEIEQRVKQIIENNINAEQRVKKQLINQLTQTTIQHHEMPTIRSQEISTLLNAQNQLKQYEVKILQRQKLVVQGEQRVKEQLKIMRTQQIQIDKSKEQLELRLSEYNKMIKKNGGQDSGLGKRQQTDNRQEMRIEYKQSMQSMQSGLLTRPKAHKDAEKWERQFGFDLTAKQAVQKRSSRQDVIKNEKRQINHKKPQQKPNEGRAVQVQEFRNIGSGEDSIDSFGNSGEVEVEFVEKGRVLPTKGMNIAKNCKIERTASDNIDNKLVKEEPKQKEIQIESNIYKEGDKQVFNEDKNSFGRNDKMSLPTFMQITTEPAQKNAFESFNSKEFKEAQEIQGQRRSRSPQLLRPTNPFLDIGQPLRSFKQVLQNPLSGQHIERAYSPREQPTLSQDDDGLSQREHSWLQKRRYKKMDREIAQNSSGFTYDKDVERKREREHQREKKHERSINYQNNFILKQSRKASMPHFPPPTEQMNNYSRPLEGDNNEGYKYQVRANAKDAVRVRQSEWDKNKSQKNQRMFTAFSSSNLLFDQVQPSPRKELYKQPEYSSVHMSPNHYRLRHPHQQQSQQILLSAFKNTLQKQPVPQQQQPRKSPRSVVRDTYYHEGSVYNNNKNKARSQHGSSMVRKYENNVTPLRAGYQMESSWQKMQAQTGDYVNLGEKLEKLREEIRKEIDSVK